jgi:hypothetical protein
MVQSLGDQVVVGAVLVVLMMAVLSWVESGRWHGAPVERQRRVPLATRRSDPRSAEPVRWQRRSSPGRKTA